MDALNEQAWKKYIEARTISKEEQNDERFCKELRESLDFALCRLHVSLCNFGNTILEVWGFKRHEAVVANQELCLRTKVKRRSSNDNNRM